MLLYRGLTLDRFQSEAIQHVQQGRSVLVSAPTGTGKTIIADYVVEQALKDGFEVVYTAPIKALSNQKYRDYSRAYGRDKVGLVTGDLVINRDAQIRIMSTEIMRNILLQDECPKALSHVIVDEVHFLDDEERGTVWEELLIYLPPRVKIVALSATLPNLEEFARWLEFVRGDTVAVVKETQRTVPLRFLLANRQSGIQDLRQFEKLLRGQKDPRSDRRGSREADESSRPAVAGRLAPSLRRSVDRHAERRERQRNRTSHLDMIQLATPDYLPVLYFVFSRRQTELFARELSRRTRRSFLNRHEFDRVQGLLAEFEHENPDVLTDVHREMYENGIAFHHAGLHVSLKALVEEMYEQRLIRVLYCTSTFALGLNMPARTVIFDALRKFNGHTVAPLTTRQFLQKAGRAGRRGMDRVGYVLIKADFSDFEDDSPLIQQYQRGTHERLQSAFNLSFSSVVNILHRHTEREIQQLLDKSFLNFSRRSELDQKKAQLEAAKHELEACRLALNTDEGTGKRLEYKRLKKRVQFMEEELEGRDEAIYARFKEKVDFLKAAGYMDDDGSFNAGARVLMSVQISEVFVAELLLEGILEDVDEDELFGVLTALVQDLPRGVILRDPLTSRWRKLKERIKRIQESETVVRSAELMGLQVPYCAELMPFGHLWAQGHSLNALMLMVQSEIDISGDLVGGFRRAKDLAGQLKAAYKDSPQMAERLANLIRKVSRDEVEVID